jgi:hypothetical protein
MAKKKQRTREKGGYWDSKECSLTPSIIAVIQKYFESLVDVHPDEESPITERTSEGIVALRLVVKRCFYSRPHIVTAACKVVNRRYPCVSLDWELKANRLDYRISARSRSHRTHERFKCQLSITGSIVISSVGRRIPPWFIDMRMVEEVPKGYQPLCFK